MTVEPKNVTGGCHCGAVRFEAEANVTDVNECNCSHCAKKGFYLAFTPRENFTLQSGEDALTEYRFNKKKIAHLFCKTCGVQPFGYGEGPDGAQMAMINVRCVDDVDPAALNISLVDGKSY